MTTSFAAAGYTLRPAATDQTAITLDAIASGEAEALGEAFAAIQPWVSYPYPAAGLAKYFADVEPGAPEMVSSVD